MVVWVIKNLRVILFFWIEDWLKGFLGIREFEDGNFGEESV